MGINTDISWHIAFFAGIASFASPCLLPMIPAYIFYMAGAGVNEDAGVSRKKALYRTLFFVMGFTVIFLILGLSASAIGKLFISNKLWFQRLAGIFIIVMGLQFIGLIKLDVLSRKYGLKQHGKANNSFGAFLMGLSFGAGWTPCFGPVLASILVLASTRTALHQGVALLLLYAFGLALPFVLTAVFINEAAALTVKFERSSLWLQKITGALLVIFGVLMSMNWLVKLNVLFI